MDYKARLAPATINYSAPAFRRLAEHHLHCADCFRPGSFSLLPYFLYCRAIELALKAQHLEKARQRAVRGMFEHSLTDAYDALDDCQKVLSYAERRLLGKASQIYLEKRLEYPRPVDALKGFTAFPDLQRLATLARRLVALTS